jgi:hypothetical protein
MSKFPRANVAKPSKVVVCSCSRCGGGGVVPPWGECFRCGGNGKDPTARDWAYPRDWTDEQCDAHEAARQARNDAARGRAATKRQAEADRAWNANVEAHPILPEANAALQAYWDGEPEPVLEGLYGDETHDSIRARNEYARLNSLPAFVSDIVSKAHRFPISEKQAALVAKALDERASRHSRDEARKASFKDVPAGRGEIEGVIVSVKHTETQAGYRTVSQTKVLVQCDGYRLYGTVPTAVEDAVFQGHYGRQDENDAKLKGTRIRFTATVQRKEPGFGFFSRPTGGEVLEAAATV